jgi:hypothetical protein
MFIGGNSEKLAEIAWQQGPRIKVTPPSAISASPAAEQVRDYPYTPPPPSPGGSYTLPPLHRHLPGGGPPGDLLLHSTPDTRPEVRKAVIEALFFISSNARTSQPRTRREDPETKRRIIEKLSVMGSKEATDYLMEFLKRSRSCPLDPGAVVSCQLPEPYDVFGTATDH